MIFLRYCPLFMKKESTLREVSSVIVHVSNLSVARQTIWVMYFNHMDDVISLSWLKSTFSHSMLAVPPWKAKNKHS